MELGHGNIYKIIYYQTCGFYRGTSDVREGRLKLGTGLGGSQTPVAEAEVKKNEAQLANSRTSSAIFGILA